MQWSRGSFAVCQDYLPLSYMSMLNEHTSRPATWILSTLATFIGTFVLVSGMAAPIAVHAQDANVYVSAVATTTPDGTQTAPFPTIEQALMVVPVGGTVHVNNSGAYTIGSTITLSTANVTLVGTGQPVIRVSGDRKHS